MKCYFKGLLLTTALVSFLGAGSVVGSQQDSELLTQLTVGGPLYVDVVGAHPIAGSQSFTGNLVGLSPGRGYTFEQGLTGGVQVSQAIVPDVLTFGTSLLPFVIGKGVDLILNLPNSSASIASPTLFLDNINIRAGGSLIIQESQAAGKNITVKFGSSVKIDGSLIFNGDSGTAPNKRSVLDFGGSSSVSGAGAIIIGNVDDNSEPSVVFKNTGSSVISVEGISLQNNGSVVIQGDLDFKVPLTGAGNISVESGILGINPTETNIDLNIPIDASGGIKVLSPGLLDNLTINSSCNNFTIDVTDYSFTMPSPLLAATGLCSIYVRDTSVSKKNSLFIFSNQITPAGHPLSIQDHPSGGGTVEFLGTLGLSNNLTCSASFIIFDKQVDLIEKNLSIDSYSQVTFRPTSRIKNTSLNNVQSTVTVSGGAILDTQFSDMTSTNIIWNIANGGEGTLRFSGDWSTQIIGAETPGTNMILEANAAVRLSNIMASTSLMLNATKGPITVLNQITLPRTVTVNRDSSSNRFEVIFNKATIGLDTHFLGTGFLRILDFFDALSYNLFFGSSESTPSDNLIVEFEKAFVTGSGITISSDASVVMCQDLSNNGAVTINDRGQLQVIGGLRLAGDLTIGNSATSAASAIFNNMVDVRSTHNVSINTQASVVFKKGTINAWQGGTNTLTSGRIVLGAPFDGNIYVAGSGCSFESLNDVTFTYDILGTAEHPLVFDITNGNINLKNIQGFYIPETSSVTSLGMDIINTSHEKRELLIPNAIFGSTLGKFSVFGGKGTVRILSDAIFANEFAAVDRVHVIFSKNVDTDVYPFHIGNDAIMDSPHVDVLGDFAGTSNRLFVRGGLGFDGSLLNSNIKLGQDGNLSHFTFRPLSSSASFGCAVVEDLGKTACVFDVTKTSLDIKRFLINSSNLSIVNNSTEDHLLRVTSFGDVLSSLRLSGNSVIEFVEPVLFTNAGLNALSLTIDENLKAWFKGGILVQGRFEKSGGGLLVAKDVKSVGGASDTISVSRGIFRFGDSDCPFDLKGGTLQPTKNETSQRIAIFNDSVIDLSFVEGGGDFTARGAIDLGGSKLVIRGGNSSPLVQSSDKEFGDSLTQLFRLTSVLSNIEEGAVLQADARVILSQGLSLSDGASLGIQGTEVVEVRTLVRNKGRILISEDSQAYFRHGAFEVGCISVAEGGTLWFSSSLRQPDLTEGAITLQGGTLAPVSFDLGDSHIVDSSDPFVLSGLDIEDDNSIRGNVCITIDNGVSQSSEGSILDISRGNLFLDQKTTVNYSGCTLWVDGDRSSNFKLRIDSYGTESLGKVIATNALVEVLNPRALGNTILKSKDCGAFSFVSKNSEASFDLRNRIVIGDDPFLFFSTNTYVNVLGNIKNETDAHGELVLCGGGDVQVNSIVGLNGFIVPFDSALFTSSSNTSQIETGNVKLYDGTVLDTTGTVTILNDSGGK